jgi:hypothetical protein
MSTITPAPRTLKARRASPATHHVGEPLGRYTDPRGCERELVCRPGAGGSMLVIDRLAGTPTDQRLVAHLAADEPPENAGIVASLYLADVHGRHCRRLTAEDLDTAPFATVQTRAASAATDLMQTGGGELVDERGCLYRLQATRSGSSIPELRWWRQAPKEGDTPPEVLSVREVIGSLESYEPARTLTAGALVAHHRDRRVSTAVLRAELDRVYASPIVLNRGLRDAVLAAVNERGLTMSEIAMRCGRFKRDTRGNVSGETSWLARRIGMLPEGGQSTPTPWVSSDVLALIARDGLDVSPREVELG